MQQRRRRTHPCRQASSLAFFVAAIAFRRTTFIQNGCIYKNGHNLFLSPKKDLFT